MNLKAAILGVGDTLLLSNLDKPWYLHCNEHNIVPIPIPADDYPVTNRLLLCDCQLQGGNEFLHESLASCPCSDKVDRNIYFTINMALAYQLQMNYPEEIPPEDCTGKLMNNEPSCLITLKDFLMPQVIWRV